MIPPPPWISEIEAVVWWQDGALHGLIAYREGPVGPYREAFAASLTVRGAQVTFMAVDSERSLAGGGANWALPKEPARFHEASGRVTVAGDGWTLHVTIRARPRSLPAAGAFLCTQPWPDGVHRRFRVSVRGSARLGSVEVDARGRRPALLFTGRQVVGGPEG